MQRLNTKTSNIMIKFFRIYIYVIFFLFAGLEGKIIYDFEKDKNLSDWWVVDDVVMGGKSLGSLDLDRDGNGIFSGYVSLKNYGGFSSIRYRTKGIQIEDFQYIVIKILGDNKFYQLRVKSNYYDRHVYVETFFAKDAWQEIKIPLKDMRPQFRGRKLRMENFNHDAIMEVGILIGNKVEEDFSLKIDFISLK